MSALQSVCDNLIHAYGMEVVLECLASHAESITAGDTDDALFLHRLAASLRATGNRVTVHNLSYFPLGGHYVPPHRTAPVAATSP